MKTFLCSILVLFFTSGQLWATDMPLSSDQAPNTNQAPSATTSPDADNLLHWQQLPSLPDQYGFAGAYAGVSNGTLLVAGGANFADKRPWDEGSQKIWYDDVYVLTDPKGQWKRAGKLPRPLAYGVSVSTSRGVVCLGGGDAQRHYADVFVLQYNDGKLAVKTLPAMPKPAAFFCGAVIGETIYVAGGKDWPAPYRPHGTPAPVPPATMKTFWSLDLSAPDDELAWKILPAWPGPSRMLAVAGVQDKQFFVFSGQTLDPRKSGDDKRVFLADGYCFDPSNNRWSRIADLPRSAAAAPSPAMPLGSAHLGVVGGDDGQLTFQADTLKDKHPGFPDDILLYHMITDTWISRGRFPKQTAEGIWSPVTTNTTTWQGHYVVPTGEARPGVRTPQIFWAVPLSAPRGFAWLDYGVLVVYLGGLVAMGFYFSKREKSTDDFFLGGQRVPWWAAGLSIFGTQLSAITFMAIPAKAFRTNWVFFMANMMIVVLAPAIVYFYLPFFRRLEITSAYEYLEKRFNKPARLLGSASFVLFQLGRMGVVLFLPALALQTVTGINIYVCIVVMGALATVYTVLGGIEAVIWTDVVQVFVLLGGALISLTVIVCSVDGGLGSVASMAAEADKLRVANLNWDIATAALWVVCVGSLFQQLVAYSSDQTCVQRYLTTPNERDAARGIWTNALLTIPASLLFFGVGTALWVFYKTHPGELSATGKSDFIFAWFIAKELPMGVSGLVIAGLFAAAMSSLDSSMNSMATAITTDFYRWLNPHAADHRCLTLARYLTILLGIIGTGSAILMAVLNNESMWDQYMKIVGLFGGGLAGLFALGIFTRRASGWGAIAGFVVSAVVLYVVTQYTTINFMLYAAVGVATCFVVGYVVSLVVPNRREEPQALTVFGLIASKKP